MSLYDSALIALFLMLSPAAAHKANAYEQEQAAYVTANSPYADRAPFDIQFLDTMQRHQRNGTAVSRLAATNATQPHIRRLAERLMVAQQQDAADLYAIAGHLFPNMPEAVNMRLLGTRPLSVGKLLASKGPEFDSVFVDMIVQHHRYVLTLSTLALKRAGSDQVRQLARRLYDRHARELAALRQLQGKVQNASADGMPH